jgi:hypothetical protein
MTLVKKLREWGQAMKSLERILPTLSLRLTEVQLYHLPNLLDQCRYSKMQTRTKTIMEYQNLFQIQTN